MLRKLFFLLVVLAILVAGVQSTGVLLSAGAQESEEPNAEAILADYYREMDSRLRQKGYSKQEVETILQELKNTPTEILQAQPGICEQLKQLPKANGWVGDKGPNTDTTRFEARYQEDLNKLCVITWSDWGGTADKAGTEDFGGLHQVHDQYDNLVKNGAKSFKYEGNNPSVDGAPWDYFEWVMPFGVFDEQYPYLLEVWALQQPGDRGALPADYSRVFITRPAKNYVPFGSKETPGFKVTWYCDGSTLNETFVPFTGDISDPVHLGCGESGMGVVSANKPITVTSKYTMYATIREPLTYDISKSCKIDNKKEWALMGLYPQPNDVPRYCDDPMIFKIGVSYTLTFGTPGSGVGSIGFTIDDPY